MSDHASEHKQHDADHLIKQRHVDDGIATRPKPVGATNKTGPTGNPYIDEGPVCERAEHQGAVCFLMEPQRARLIGELKDRIAFAHKNFLEAVGRVRMDKLVESDSSTDLSWLALLFLDLVTDHISTLIAVSLNSLMKAGAKKIAKVRDNDALHNVDADHGLAFGFAEHLANTSEDTVKAVTKKLLDSAKKSVISSSKSAHTPAKTQKQEAIAYIDALAESAGHGFVVISETLPKVADDAALVTFYESFDDRHHQMSQYADAVAAKVERFMSSGVTQIGRRAYVRKRQAGRGSDELDRDVRVVWVDFMSGAPRRLAFEHQDLYQAARPPTPPVYGDGIRYTGAPERGFSEADGTNWLVPDEFVDVALQRHQQVWSDPPPTVLYDDSDAFIWGKARSSAAIEYKRSHGKAPAPQPPTPGSARPVTVPDALKLHSATSSTDDQDGAP